MDRTVSLGQRYGYRVGFLGDGGESFQAEAWVEVPGHDEMALKDQGRARWRRI